MKALFLTLSYCLPTELFSSRGSAIEPLPNHDRHHSYPKGNPPTL